MKEDSTLTSSYLILPKNFFTDIREKEEGRGYLGTGERKRQRERERERERARARASARERASERARETPVLLFHLFMHSFVGPFMCPDQGLHSNQLSGPARPHLLILKTRLLNCYFFIVQVCNT